MGVGKKCVYLDTEVTSINVVAQEEVTRGCWAAAELKQFHEVVLGIVRTGGHSIAPIARKDSHIGRGYHRRLTGGDGR